MTTRNSWLKRAGAVAALMALLGAAADSAHAKPAPGKTRRGFDLFAESFGLFNVNRVACGIVNRGAICYDPGGSPIGGGGFWPKGTPDGYVYGSGLQAAGIIAANAGFSWAGDTVGAQFYDPSTGPLHGAGLTPVYNSIAPADLAAWPNGGVVRDASLYSAAVLGQNSVSQQDLWWRSWDGDPALLTGRKHPLGILVETRALGWNYPAGNQDIQYLLFTFTNISASDPTKYNGVDAAIRSEIADIGKQYADGIKSRLNVTLPPAGYRIDSLYVALASDTDVGPTATDNYSTAILPFNLGLAYIDDFSESAFTYPPDIFAPPFAVGPGFVGAKYLKSPINPATSQQVGLTMFSNTLNPNTCVSGLCDATNVVQLWRYLSGNINPAAGDNPCTVAAPKTDKVCFLSQTSADTRFFQASGPFSLDAGQSATIVVAYLFAPAVSGIAGLVVGSDNPPGIPSTGAQIAANPGANIRFIERAAGWVSEADTNPVNGAIDQGEVRTVPASLLAKAMVAQKLFDNKFLLPASPTAPNFYLVPGENKVAIIWQPSTTETVGDPYFGVASSLASGSLYDPNYRRFDVEGYRVYRGRTQGNLELIGQFDYTGTVFRDFNGSFDYGTRCAPELGLNTALVCPVAFDMVTFTVSSSHPLSGDVVQVPRPPVAAGRVLLAGGTTVKLVKSDTAVAGAESGSFPALDDTGVPFAIVDTTVRNSFTYFYAVTAFDVNSLQSGPTSLESARITKTVTPRAPAINQVASTFNVDLVGRNTVLSTTATGPTINATTGVFSGPAAPTTNFRLLGAQLFAEHALKASSATIRIDSVVPNYYHQATYYLTVTGATTFQQVLGPVGPLGDEDGNATLGPVSVLVGADSALLASKGLDNLPFAGRGSVDLRLVPTAGFSKDADWHATAAGAFFARPATFSDAGGSRWFTGTNESMADPALGVAHGQLTGVTGIYRPSAFGNVLDDFFRRFDQTTYHVFRAADIRFYWGATAGLPDSVIDVTHNVVVPFSGQNRASWGIANATTNSPGSTAVNYLDFFGGPCLLLAANTPSQVGCASRNYVNAAVLNSVDCTGDGLNDGTGFGLYVNGEPFIFCAAALPTSTVWTYRAYSGEVKKTGATYSFTQRGADPAVPGLSYRFQAVSPATFPTTADVDLTKVHTVPDPYYVTSNLESTTNRKILKFVNLPNQAIIRIYSVSGVLVSVITHNDAGGGGEETWNLRNRNNQFVASGVYFYHLETPSGQERIGRFTVVNFAQ